MIRAKGKLVAPRRGKKSTKAERRDRALDRAKSILGQSEFDRVQTLFQSMNVVGNKSRPVLDGIIMGLLQRNLSHYQIRSVTGIGGPRVKRVERVMKNPALLNKKRPRPHHAVSDEDVDNLKSDLQK